MMIQLSALERLESHEQSCGLCRQVVGVVAIYDNKTVPYGARGRAKGKIKDVKDGTRSEDRDSANTNNGHECDQSES